MRRTSLFSGQLKTQTDLREYGSVGKGGDDTAVLTAAINSLSSTGGILIIPAGTYNFTQLDMRAMQGITIRGVGNLGDSTQPVILNCTAASSASAIIVGSSRGLKFENIKFTNNSASFTGWYLDAKALTGDTAYLTVQDCLFVGEAGRNAAGLVRLDGVHDVDLVRCGFRNAQVGVYGKSTNTISATGGFALGVSIRKCTFYGGIVTACIKNADSSWDIEAVFEPLQGGAAGAYLDDTGITPNGPVTFRNCWAGDDVNTATGTWIKFGGNGLHIIGGFWSINASTTLCEITAASVKGVHLTGATLYAQYGTGKGIVFPSGAGYTRLDQQARNVWIAGNAWTGAWGVGLAVVNAPVGSFVETHASPAPGYLPFTSRLDVGSLMCGGVQNVNLLPATSAENEGSIAWLDNSNATRAVDASAAKSGSQGVRLTATANGSTCSIMANSFTGAVTGVIPGQPYVALAHIRPLVTARAARITLYFYDAGNTNVGQYSSPNMTTTLNTWSKLSVQGIAPATATKIGVAVTVVSVVAGETFDLDEAGVMLGTSDTWSAGGQSSAPLHQFTSGGIGLNGAAVAAKSTGWGAPTGVATKTTFDTTTVTTAQLAERVKALIDYLTTRGDIGG